MQCKTCDPPRLSPIHMVRRPGGRQLVMGGSRIRATLSVEDAIQNWQGGSECPPALAHSWGRNIAG